MCDLYWQNDSAFRKEYIVNKYVQKKFIPSSNNIDYRLERDFMIKMVTMQGWITKQGGKRKNWRKRYAILNGNVLNYYTAQNDSYPKGSLQLESTRSVVVL